MYDVFLSHNSRDKPAVHQLAERLRGDGLRVWFDDWVVRPGDDIYLKIEEGLERSRVLVLVMSPNTFGSDWVNLERGTSLFRDPANRQRRFVPLLIADCKIPDVLRRYRYIDFRHAAETEYRTLLKACQGEEEGALEHAEGVRGPQARRHDERARRTSAAPGGRSASPFSGKHKVAFWTGLATDWQMLANHLEIPPHEQARFGKGEEGRPIWEWLENRRRLDTLPEALRSVGREDLADRLVTA